METIRIQINYLHIKQTGFAAQSYRVIENQVL